MGREALIDAVAYFAKYFFIFVSSSLCYCRMLNLKPKHRLIRAVVLVLLGILLCAVMTNFRSTFGSFTLLYLIIVEFLTYIILYRTDMGAAITATLMASGMTMIFTTVAGIGLAVLAAALSRFIGWSNQYLIAMALIIGVLMFVLSVLIFKIRRFRRGFAFLNSQQGNRIGLLISILILFAGFILAYVSNEENTSFIIVILSLIFIGFLFFFWTKRRIEAEYVGQLRKRDIRLLEDELNRVKQDNEALRFDNEQLGKIIHKDNKLLPAMDLAVRDFLRTAAEEPDHDERVRQGQLLLEALDKVSGERAGVVKTYELTSKELPKTGIPRIDSMMNFMLKQAGENGADFSVTLSGNAAELIGSVISEDDACTLLADLAQNGLIAVRNQEGAKRVLVEINADTVPQSICVCDNGSPFPPEVIVAWGTRRVTMHADTGGSGIGMMQTAETCVKYRASFSVEPQPDDSLYTKRICFKLDDKCTAFGLPIQVAETTEA